MNIGKPSAFVALLLTCEALAFETTQVLPEGVRNFNIRNISTDTSHKTNEHGHIEPLAEPLWKPLRFRNILSSEQGLKRKQLEALLIQQGWSTEDSVGDFYADLNARINVTAPIFAYGYSKTTTLAMALPIYTASTDIEVGFRTNEGAERFIGALTDPAINQNKSAVEAAEKLSDAVSRLNTKLQDNDYNSLEPWNETAVGDLTLAAKHLVYDGDIFKAAFSEGVVAPTGRRDSPKILTDLPFGDGQWDLFAQVISDQFLTDELMLNQHLKYTYQTSSRKKVRLKTEDETIEVDSDNLTFKLGDKVDAGTSIQYQHTLTGINAGAGMLYFRKFGDTYYTSDRLSKEELQRETDQDALYWQYRLGISTVDMYRRKDFPVPLMASVEFRKQFKSRNLPKTNFTQLDLRIFF